MSKVFSQRVQKEGVLYYFLVRIVDRFLADRFVANRFVANRFVAYRFCGFSGKAQNYT